MKFIVFIAFFISCGYQEYDIVYKIPKGEHYSIPRLTETLDESKLSFNVVFNETDTCNSHSSINKLYGFTDCTSVEKNSARIGWRWYNQRLELFSYVHCNYSIEYTYITSISLNQATACSITIQDNNYLFCVNNICIIQRRCSTCNVGVYYMLQPYFGGTDVAPRDIFIKIKRF